MLTFLKLNFKRKFVFLFLFFLVSKLLQADVIAKNSQSKYCIGCHEKQVKEWSDSWHSKSHKEKNILYKKMIEFIAKKECISEDKVIVKCAICHNSRLKIKDVHHSYAIAQAYGFENSEVKKVKEAINDKQVKEGINCVVCHQVKEIKDINGTYKGGYNQVIWGESDTFFGPFGGDKSTHHKSIKKEHFGEDINRLCNVCHHGNNNKNNLTICNTGLEAELSGSSQKCVKCHMSDKLEGKIGESLVNEGLSKMIRKHSFVGVRNSNIVNRALDIELKTDDKNIYLYIKNLTPHKLPTGFGGRELDIEIIIKDKDSKIIKSITKRLKAVYLDEDDKETIPYLGVRLKEDLRINPNEKREFLLYKEQKGSFLEIAIWYKLLNDELVKLLNIEDEIFTKKYLVVKKELKL